MNGNGKRIRIEEPTSILRTQIKTSKKRTTEPIYKKITKKSKEYHNFPYESFYE